MYIDRRNHWQFLEDELKAETEEFNKKFMKEIGDSNRAVKKFLDINKN